MHTQICPECGKPFDPDVLPLARVPWLYRIRLGAMNAYIETVKVILQNPAAFAAELCRPARISQLDARRFRSVTNWVAAISGFLPTLAFAGLLALRGDREATEFAGIAFGVLAGVWVFSNLATDTPTFIWPAPDPSRPHDLSPIQCYAAAPMALAVAPISLGAVALGCDQFLPGAPLLLTVLFSAMAMCAALVLLFRLCWTPVVFMRVSMRCSRARSLALLLYLPFHYVLVGLVGCIFGCFAVGLSFGIISGILQLFH
jgi:hypothetical protein